jgi:hypothetical protein
VLLGEEKERAFCYNASILYKHLRGIGISTVMDFFGRRVWKVTTFGQWLEANQNMIGHSCFSRILLEHFNVLS